MCIRIVTCITNSKYFMQSEFIYNGKRSNYGLQYYFITCVVLIDWFQFGGVAASTECPKLGIRPECKSVVSKNTENPGISIILSATCHVLVSDGDEIAYVRK